MSSIPKLIKKQKKTIVPKIFHRFYSVGFAVCVCLFQEVEDPGQIRPTCQHSKVRTVDGETTIAQGLHITDDSAGYDAACKRVLSESFLP